MPDCAGMAFDGMRRQICETPCQRLNSGPGRLSVPGCRPSSHQTVDAVHSDGYFIGQAGDVGRVLAVWCERDRAQRKTPVLVGTPHPTKGPPWAATSDTRSPSSAVMPANDFGSLVAITSVTSASTLPNEACAAGRSRSDSECQLGAANWSTVWSRTSALTALTPASYTAAPRSRAAPVTIIARPVRARGCECVLVIICLSVLWGPRTAGLAPTRGPPRRHGAKVPADPTPHADLRHAAAPQHTRTLGDVSRRSRLGTAVRPRRQPA